MTSRRRRRAAVAAAAGAVALALPASASAHGIGSKQPLPLPGWLFAWAAMVVLVVSFIGLAVAWSRPRLQDVVERRRFAVPRLFEALAGGLGIAAFVAVVYAGFAGVQVETANLIPTVVYVFFWVAVPILSLLFGDVFQAVNPWRAVGRAVGWAVQRIGGPQTPAPLAYPVRLGHWPAVVGIAAFAWVELVYADRGDPSQLAIMALAYAAVQLVGMSLYGVEAWSARGDAFGVYFGLFSRMSPLHWRDRALYTRPPLSGLPSMPVEAGTVALLAVMIGTTSFDGLSQGDLWNTLAGHLQDGFTSVGLSAEHALEAAGTVGLLAMVGVVGGLYRLGIAGMRTVGRGHQSGELARSFVHSLVPIALAYVIAHYFSLLAYQGQAIAPLASDPLGHGSDLLGTADWGISYTWIGSRAISYIQVAALLIGHVAGLALAHDRALATYRRVREATRSQYWMLAVMVGFTCLGLWLLFSTV